MHRPALRSLLLAAVAIAAWPAHAEIAPATSCAAPSSSDPLGDRASLLAAYERLPRPCLQALFTACSEASDRALLDLGSAAACSLSYEALLRQAFGGDFGQLMARWRGRKAAQAD